jgi:GxxExxY protein
VFHGDYTEYIRNMEIIEKELSDVIFKSALYVHKTLGPGLLESAYQKCLILELINRGLIVLKEVQVNINYLDTIIENAYKIDLLVEDKIIIECKSIDALAPVHVAQLMTYLRLSEKKLGLLINFNVMLLKEGYKRIVL